MESKLESPTSLPTKQRFAGVLRLFGRISYWIHLILGTTSGIILGLVLFSRNLGEQTNSTAINTSIIFAISSLVIIGVRVFWAWRYGRMAKQLQTEASTSQPSRAKIIHVLQVGLLISLLGLFFAFIASEITTVSVVAEALAKPQTETVYQPEKAIRTADLFLVLANINILGAHFLGSLNSLGLLNWITKE
jgi:uncharacterized membrane protein